MSLPKDLLAQARLLATSEKRRPLQASLRRAVSACYYALFHLLVQDASRRLIGRHTRTALGQCLSRAFDHASMYRVASQFARLWLTFYSGGNWGENVLSVDELKQRLGSDVWVNTSRSIPVHLPHRVEYNAVLDAVVDQLSELASRIAR